MHLIGTASARFLGLKATVLCAEAFPIKANDYTSNYPVGLEHVRGRVATCGVA